MTRRNPCAKRISTVKVALAVFALILMLISDFAPQFQLRVFSPVRAQPGSGVVTFSPAFNWGPFVGTQGDLQVNLNRSGIAVRVEIPREFIDANFAFGPVINQENDTHFIESDIKNDYYYYSVIDEANRWSYLWKGNNSQPNNAPCFKPGFSYYDPNAPWCVEIWNFLNGSFHNFTAPKFVRFHGLNAPTIAGVYNVTVFIATHNYTAFGYPDFVHAWNETIRVPVSMKPNPGFINGTIVDCVSNEVIKSKGVVYALSNTGAVVAKAYVNPTTGRFNLTGLDKSQSYTVQGSAGQFRESSGIVWAFSLTPFTTSPLCSGPPASVGVTDTDQFVLPLLRAPQIWGSVGYHDSVTDTDITLGALGGHPWLTQIDPNIKVLNITVEAKDTTTQIIYRNQSISHTLVPLTDPASDKFEIITGSGVKYVGTNPYGTEFAGLPQTASLNVQVWATGYIQHNTCSVTVDSPGNSGNPNIGTRCPVQQGQSDLIRMDSAGLIEVKIQFVRDNATLTAESPHTAEASLGVSPITDTIFGGNIEIQAYNSAGLLSGATFVNGTLPDGRTSYADRTSVTYFVIGFSEYYNRTWSGLLKEPDYGLMDDVYTLSVFVRGYEQVGTVSVRASCIGNLNPGICNHQPVTVFMKKGGAFLVTITSFNNRFGSRVPQTPEPWQFLNLSIPVRARVYFSGPFGTVGYVERLMVTHVPISHIPNGVNRTYFNVVFAGQNWSLRDLWFGSVPPPTHLTDATYSIKAYTLGYVQLRVVPVPAMTGVGVRTGVTLLIGNGIGLIGSLFIAPPFSTGIGPPQSNFTALTERVHTIANAYSGSGLAGALPGNVSLGVETLRMPIFGFGAMVNISVTYKDGKKVANNGFMGLGHFFYEPPDGSGCVNYGFSQDFNHCFDYGLDIGNYTTIIPEFGFTRHFMQLPAPLYFYFSDLGFLPDPGVNLIAMGKITGDIQTENEFPPPQSIALSWIRVEATNGTIGGCSTNDYGTIDKCVPTMDGIYNGVGAIFVPGVSPGGFYRVIATDLAGFCTATNTTVTVGWNGAASYSPLMSCVDPPPGSPASTNAKQPTGYLDSGVIPLYQWPKNQRFLNVTPLDEHSVFYKPSGGTSGTRKAEFNVMTARFY